MTALSTMQDASEMLKTRGYRTSFEYPGCIHIELNDTITLVAGDVNETWGADVHIHHGANETHCDESINTPIPSDSNDPIIITLALDQAIKAWQGQRA